MSPIFIFIHLITYTTINRTTFPINLELNSKNNYLNALFCLFLILISGKLTKNSSFSLVSYDISKNRRQIIFSFQNIAD